MNALIYVDEDWWDIASLLVHLVAINLPTKKDSFIISWLELHEGILFLEQAFFEHATLSLMKATAYVSMPVSSINARDIEKIKLLMNILFEWVTTASGTLHSYVVELFQRTIES